MVRFIPYITLLASLSLLTPAEAKDGKSDISSVVIPSEDESEFPAKIYDSLELRHQLNTYYGSENQRSRQMPSIHGRAKLGATFRNGLIDGYFTFGLIKSPNTQQIQQRRPEFEIDIYPWMSRYGQIVQYNLVQFPFDINDYEASENKDYTSDTVYTIGIAPTLILPLHLFGSKLTLKTGVDYWTQFFSGKQYRNDDREPSERDHFAAAGDGSGESNSEEPVEDVAMRYYSQYMTGLGISPSWDRDLSLEVGAFYDVKYLPEYEKDSESNDYRYIRETHSHYRLRLHYKLSTRASFVNDFYHFHSGLFEKKRYGDDRRFRNIARLSYKL